jgi:hypothetical protein
MVDMKNVARMWMDREVLANGLDQKSKGSYSFSIGYPYPSKLTRKIYDRQLSYSAGTSTYLMISRAPKLVQRGRLV